MVSKENDDKTEHTLIYTILTYTHKNLSQTFLGIGTRKSEGLVLTTYLGLDNI